MDSDSSNDGKGYTHGYDDRNDMLTIDLFDLSERHLNRLPDSMGNPSQDFKLLVVNIDLLIDLDLSNGGAQGDATSKLIWEGIIFWHWDERSCDGEREWYRSMKR